MSVKNLLRFGIFVTFSMVASLSHATVPQETVYVFTGTVVRSHILKENGVQIIEVQDYASCKLIETYKEKPVPLKPSEMITIFATGDGVNFKTHVLAKVPADISKQAEKMIDSHWFYTNRHFQRCAP